MHWRTHSIGEGGIMDLEQTSATCSNPVPVLGRGQCRVGVGGPASNEKSGSKPLASPNFWRNQESVREKTPPPHPGLARCIACLSRARCLPPAGKSRASSAKGRFDLNCDSGRVRRDSCFCVLRMFVNRILARRPYSCSDRIPNPILNSF